MLASRAYLASRRDHFKRTVDLLDGLVLFSIFLPVMAVVALAVRFESPGPILFRQKRLGIGGHPFTVYKWYDQFSSRVLCLTHVIQFANKIVFYHNLGAETSIWVGPVPCPMDRRARSGISCIIVLNLCSELSCGLSGNNRAF